VNDAIAYFEDLLKDQHKTNSKTASKCLEKLKNELGESQLSQLVREKYDETLKSQGLLFGTTVDSEIALKQNED
jgi:ferritin-like metal-binding protein YciE